jgi:imidazolonepropionase-like amidohydrolase
MHMSVGWLALAPFAVANGAIAAEPAVAAARNVASAVAPLASAEDPDVGAKPETLFIRAEHVITRPGRDLGQASILVRGGRILAIGTDLAKPDDAREITGRYACAGMIDAWGAIGLGQDSIEESGGSAATRTTDGLDPYNFEVMRRDALRAGITTARVQAGAPSRVGGLGAVIRLSPGLTREEMIVVPDCNLWMTVGLSQPGQPMFEQQGDTFVMTGFGSRPMDPFERIEGVDRLVSMLQAGKNYLVSKNEYKHELEAWQKAITEKEAELEKDAKKAKKDREKAEKEATEKGKKFEEKKYKEDKKPTAPRYDEDNEVIARAANGEIPLIVHANRVAEIRALLAGSESMGRLRLVIAGGAESAYFSQKLAERRIPVIVWPAPMGKNRPDELEGNDLSLAARLAQDGVKVLIGSGGMDPAATRDLPLLADLAVGAGLDREDAFEALTIGAATTLDAADRLGSLEAGKDADILVLDGEPLVSTTRVMYVVAGGRVVVTPED